MKVAIAHDLSGFEDVAAGLARYIDALEAGEMDADEILSRGVDLLNDLDDTVRRLRHALGG